MTRCARARGLNLPFVVVVCRGDDDRGGGGGGRRFLRPPQRLCRSHPRFSRLPRVELSINIRIVARRTRVRARMRTRNSSGSHLRAKTRHMIASSCVAIRATVATLVESRRC